jgi:hypothetical protein
MIHYRIMAYIALLVCYNYLDLLFAFFRKYYKPINLVHFLRSFILFQQNALEYANRSISYPFVVFPLTILFMVMVRAGIYCF